VASWEFSGGSGDLNWVPSLLGIVELITLHSDVLSEIFVSVHSNSPQFVVGWGAGNSVNAS